LAISNKILIALRKEKGWSQEQLAAISGLSGRTIQRIEKDGACSLESKMALAAALEIAPYALDNQTPIFDKNKINESHYLFENSIKEIGKEIHKHEPLFLALSEFSPIGVYLTCDKGEFLYVNKAWQDIAGLTEEQALNKGWQAACHRDDLNNILASWDNLLLSKSSLRSEYRIVNQKTGNITFLLSLAKPLMDNSGCLKGYLGINLEIKNN